ncbi:hypothetical protein SLITO_v1c04630 [Spiroplasma litorale]|uniref:ABC transporter permease n=1 Tax=Spiroplasma litorale TaxID=216942 RepID=A0A0K1W1Q6_9MOLU|nr:hypothetical protein SLITO_v1c04630 [Spiroplasma litorale]
MWAKNNFKNTFVIFLKNNFSNYKTYVWSFLLPFILFFALITINTNIFKNILLPPLLLNILSISIFCTSFFISITIIDWKKRFYLKKLLLGNLNKRDFLISIYLINVILNTVSFLINYITYLILCKTGYLVIHVKILSNLNFGVWILYIMTMLLTIFFLTVLSFFLTSLSKKRSVNLLYIIIILFFTIIFSDTVLNPKIMNNNLLLLIIGYFNPIKYFVWSGMMVSSYAIFDKYGFTQILPRENSAYIPFDSMYQSLIPCLIFVAIILYLYIRFFAWGDKK